MILSELKWGSRACVVCPDGQRRAVLFYTNLLDRWINVSLPPTATLTRRIEYILRCRLPLQTPRRLKYGVLHLPQWGTAHGQ